MQCTIVLMVSRNPDLQSVRLLTELSISFRGLVDLLARKYGASYSISNTYLGDRCAVSRFRRYQKLLYICWVVHPTVLR